MIQPGPLRGIIRVPGDKSISHRALIVSAASRHPITVTNVNPGRDVLATMNALRAVGARVERAQPEGAVTVCAGELHDPYTAIDCMNSGSTARMMMGVLSGANLHGELIGDESLRARPMEPVSAQLRAFGARIQTADGTLPATVRGTDKPQTRRFILLAPSAQIKTALLLAGLFAGVAVATFGDKGSRDHTERLLRWLDADIDFDRSTVEMRSGPRHYRDVEVVGDFSAAAFFIAAATVAPGSSIRILSVGVNQSRTGLLEALQHMGARIRLENRHEICGEPVADIAVDSAELRGIAVGADIALRAVDEIMVLAVAAAFARGATRITGIADLRNKETDRIAAVERLLAPAGIRVETLPNGIAVHGGAPRCTGATAVTEGDHRTAMAAAALAAGAGPVVIDDESAIEVSFPFFLQTLQRSQQR